MTMIKMTSNPTRGEVLGIAKRLVREGKDVHYVLPQRAEARIREATGWLDRPGVDPVERNRVAYALLRASQGVVRSAEDLILDAQDTWASVLTDPTDKDWLAFAGAVWCRRERCRRAARKAAQSA
jgi:hypothetical protein